MVEAAATSDRNGREVSAPSIWSSPVAVTLVAGAATFATSLLVSSVNGYLNLKLEQQKAEAALILQAVQAGDSLQRAANLKFFLDAGLIEDKTGSIKRVVDSINARGALPLLPLVAVGPPDRDAERASLFAQEVGRLMHMWRGALPHAETVVWSDGSQCGPLGDHADPFLNYLKNRTDIPKTYAQLSWQSIGALPYPEHAPFQLSQWSDEDLTQLAQRAGDAVSVTGFIVAVRAEGREGVNCNATEPERVDWHILVAPRSTTKSAEAMVTEVTPRVRVAHAGWTLAALRAQFQRGDSVRVSGWLLPDPGLRREVGRSSATLWEVHPVTKIEVFDGRAWRNIER